MSLARGARRRRRRAVAQVDAAAAPWDLSAMAVRVSKNVSLTPQLEAFVDDQIASGRYQTASEVVRAGSRLPQSQQRRERRAGRRPWPEPPAAGAAPRGAS